MVDRKQISALEVDDAVSLVHQAVEMRLRQKGRGSFASRHELLGIMGEEQFEFTEAVHEADTSRIRHELIDIAVAAVFGLACLSADGFDW